MINDKLKKALIKRGITSLTEPQKEALPKILSGKNILLCAPTGYGKTLAVMIPVFHKMIGKSGLRTLYITPLRALNRDIFERMVELGKDVDVKVEIRHGDTTKSERRRQVKSPPNMLITTPETLQAMLTGKRLREILKDVETIIIDEVHELVSSKRGAQLSIGLERLKKLINKKIQIIGLSATINNKREVADWLDKECSIINIEGEKKYDIKVIKQKITEEDKEFAKKLHTSPATASNLRYISNLIKNQKTLIFVNTRELAENISSRFKSININVGIHHSSLSKESRVETEKAFKEGKLQSIISTSSLELGIDIGDIDLVVQYNSPRQVNKLIQRVGRAGHKSDAVSKGIVLTSNEYDYLESLAILNKLKEKWVEESPIYYKPLDVLAHQIVGCCLDEYKPNLKDIYNLIKKARPYRNLSWREFNSVVDVLKKVKLIFVNEDGSVGIGRKARIYYFDNLSTIPSEKNYKVIDASTNKPVGTLHEGFIAKHGQPGNIFICKAQPWEILSIENDKVIVSRSFDFDSAIPSWEGELLPIHKEVSTEVMKLGNKKRKIEYYDNQVIITTYFGSKINQTIGEVLAYYVSKKTETTIGIKSDAYRIVLTLKDARDIDLVEEVIKEIKPSWIAPISFQAVKNTSAYLYRFMHVAKRFGVLRKDAEFSNYRIKKLLEVWDDSPISKEAYKEMLVEKLDLVGAEECITLINGGKLQFEKASKETIEELSTGFKDFSNPKTQNEILDLVKERLLNTHYLFYCLVCGKYLGRLMVRDSKNLKCSCGSKLITFLKSNENSIFALRKHLTNKPLNKEEEKELKKLEQRANMYLSYDYMAPYTLAGRGVGVRTAQRILNGFYKTEQEFLRKIVEAEKNFIKTKKYWS